MLFRSSIQGNLTVNGELSSDNSSHMVIRLKAGKRFQVLNDNGTVVFNVSENGTSIDTSVSLSNYTFDNATQFDNTTTFNAAATFSVAPAFNAGIWVSGTSTIDNVSLTSGNGFINGNVTLQDNVSIAENLTVTGTTTSADRRAHV